VRQLGRDLVSDGGLFVRGIVGHLIPDGDPGRSCCTGSTRLATGYVDRSHDAE